MAVPPPLAGLEGQKQHSVLFCGLLGVTSTTESFRRSSCILRALYDDTRHQSSVSPSKGSREGPVGAAVGLGDCAPRASSLPTSPALALHPTQHPRNGATETLVFCLFPSVLSSLLCARHGARDSE